VSEDPRQMAGDWAKTVQPGDRVLVNGVPGTVGGYGPRYLFVRLDGFRHASYPQAFAWSQCTPLTEE
jgi:hypothetical protein